MAYVITGATGHIGNNLARSLIQNHKEVVILTRRMDRAIEGLHANLLSVIFLMIVSWIIILEKMTLLFILLE